MRQCTVEIRPLMSYRSHRFGCRVGKCSIFPRLFQPSSWRVLKNSKPVPALEGEQAGVPYYGVLKPCFSAHRFRVSMPAFPFVQCSPHPLLSSLTRKGELSVFRSFPFEQWGV